MAEKSWAQKVRDTQVWKSIFRHGPPDNARNRAAVVAGNVFLHLHPIKLKKSGVLYCSLGQPFSSSFSKVIIPFCATIARPMFSSPIHEPG